MRSAVMRGNMRSLDRVSVVRNWVERNLKDHIDSVDTRDGRTVACLEQGAYERDRCAAGC
jgi:hypothetical protein